MIVKKSQSKIGMLEEHSTHPLDLIALLQFVWCYGSKVVCVMCDESILTLF